MGVPQSFQDVQNLTVFVEDNNGAEFSALSGLSLIGETKAGMNMNDFKASGGPAAIP